ncbi:MAG: aspartate-semialdehyde dehydrogenase [Saprospiraceae bacterium]|nr:aspartate-semialdehyde dehydrogenase [Saprospiraceae bacterium]
MRVAVVGVTGLVGTVMCEVLKERNFPISEFIPVASARSVGKQIEFSGRNHTIVSLEDAVNLKPDFALFSAGGNVSLEWAPKFAEVGTTVVDNSSAWRMHDDIPLVVPEVNADVLTEQDRIIANPNCSTIQLVVALAPLEKAFGIKRLVISTYQSITGTGVKALNQYDAEREGNPLSQDENAYHYPIFDNCIPHCDIFLENDYTKEEMKLVHESRKILGHPELAVTATAVRVPVHGGHSEAVNIEFSKDVSIEQLKSTLREAPGIVMQDDPAANDYPMPLFAKHKDEVFVGRIRIDESQKNTFNIWVVADNLRKGAATNTIQIAEYLIAQGLVKGKGLQVGA